MKRCEYCGEGPELIPYLGGFVTAWEETKGNCSIIRREKYPREIGGKLRAIYYHEKCSHR